ncbi:class I SAM-dependent methyltransferase [Hugenholtzia roseola]|uniref:class I SAM-dependent methyltransferase n=1 Tax=Hugenholtzia roseola TaxID=1002 RepID=UPI0003FFDE9A|nr:class I SAM-dependent methyltransferase [Hugenholtzia roseola]
MTKVEKSLFQEGHYLGRPADFADKIISRRIRLLHTMPDFFGKGYSLIEIGCGAGATLLQVAPAFQKGVGIEIFEGHAPLFEKYRRELGVENATFRVFDVERETPFEEFDRLISFEVIEHLNSEESVRFYAQTLKKGGLGAISVPNKWWIFETHGAKLPLLPWNRVPFFSWLPTPLHERWANARIYTRKRIKAVLEKAGLEVVEMQYVTAPLDVLPESALKRWLLKWIFKNDTTKFPFLSTAIFVWVRKP